MAPRLVELVDAYSLLIYPAVLQQHEGSSVSSPLGIWLLLAAIATAGVGPGRKELESTLGCSASEAQALLGSFLAAPPTALAAAVALWTGEHDETPELLEWRKGLPREVATGVMPSQAEADSWIAQVSLGLIRRCPVSIDALERIVLLSVLATKVSWKKPFELVKAEGHLGPSSPWSGHLDRLLYDDVGNEYSGLAHTSAAGVVAVHFAFAREDLVVVSVSADPAVERLEVYRAAHEVVDSFRRRPPKIQTCSLFDLPLGEGHSWVITERVVPSTQSGQIETVRSATLPAWTVQANLDLKRSDLFGATVSLAALRRLIGPDPRDATEAKQTATASFTRAGFSAAAATAFAIKTSSALRVLTHQAVERNADLRFDHPYVAMAMVYNPKDTRGELYGLPAFSAWVATPEEPEIESDQPGLDGLI
jgi:hypothetical protein